MKSKSQGNVILFPHLIERFLDMAMEARENGEFQKAREYLEHVLQFEKQHAPAMLGLIVTYYDLKMFREASDLAEYMLLHGLGEYSEVLQLYVVSLIQLEEYARVCEILAAVLSEDQLTPAKHKELEEIYSTCTLLLEAMEQEQEEPIIRAKVEERMQSDENFIKKLIEDLDEGDFDRQLQVIEQLKYAKDPLVTGALRNYCIIPHVDPVLKTFALRALKFLDVKDQLLVYKFDQLLEVSLDDIPADEDGLCPEQRKVIELVSKHTYHEDPIFVSFVMQMWVEYLFSAFPLIPSLKHPASWSAALHFVVAQLLAQKPSLNDVAKKYGTTVTTLNKRLNEFNRVLPLKKRLMDNQQLPDKTD